MYEEYMQNFFNFPVNGYMDTYNQRNELENYYPEIYKIVYPMVKKVCSQNSRGISKDVVDNMVEEVYRNIEVSDVTRINITLNNDVRGEEITENKEENRQMGRNNFLNDLIRILVLRELIGGCGCIGGNWNRGLGAGPWQAMHMQRYGF